MEASPLCCSEDCRETLLVAGNIETVVQVEVDVEAVGSSSLDIILDRAKAAIADRGRFIIAVSGGSIPPILSPLIAFSEKVDTQLDKWFFVFADERCVPTDDNDSNYKLWKSEIFDKIESFDTEHNVLPIVNVDDSARCAVDYAFRLKSFLALEDISATDCIIDLAILGMGPDGHTASLFPNHELVLSQCGVDHGNDVIVHLTDSPKLPPSRITFSLPALNSCREVLFIVTGAGKAEVISSIFSISKDEAAEGARRKLICVRTADYPASLIRTPNSGAQVIWIMDKSAGKLLLDSK